MDLNTISELFELIAKSKDDDTSRSRALQLRKSALKSFVSGNGFTKIAFDTRRIDQGTEIIPRRGLQNYQRSEAFLTEAMGEKLKYFAKLKKVLGSLQETYGREHEWQDSNARILLATLEKGLRTNYQDGDFTESQPGVGSLDYIEELLQVRYRLGFDDLRKMADSDLKKIILSKDENLTRKDVNRALEITKSDVGTQSYDTLLEKLFGGMRATKENPEVERTVTITVKDKFVEK